MNECQLASTTIHYESFGQGRPLLMLHGWPVDHHHMVSDFEPLFAQRDGWRRIYPDLPGMGETPAPPWLTTQDQMLEIILDFIDHVMPAERFVLAGTSYGGYLGRGVLHCRAAWMDGLMLTVPLIRFDIAQEDLPPHVCLFEDRELLARLEPQQAADFASFAVVQTPELMQSLLHDIGPAIERADKGFCERFDTREGLSFKVDHLAQAFDAPTLILTGRQDSDCGYRATWDLIENFPRGTFAVLDRAGHGLGTEQRGLFRALTSEWLDRVEEFCAAHGRRQLQVAASS